MVQHRTADPVAMPIVFHGHEFPASECPLCPGHARIYPPKALAKHKLRHRLMSLVEADTTQLVFCRDCGVSFTCSRYVRRSRCKLCSYKR